MSAVSSKGAWDRDFRLYLGLQCGKLSKTQQRCSEDIGQPQMTLPRWKYVSLVEIDVRVTEEEEERHYARGTHSMAGYKASCSLVN